MELEVERRKREGVWGVGDKGKLREFKGNKLRKKLGVVREFWVGRVWKFLFG